MFNGIQQFAGEFMFSPAGLELSLNRCGFDCSYCFANLQQPDRKADVPQIINLLANHETRKGQEAQLLRARVPLLVSNRVDAFAGTNAAIFEPIWELCTELGIPLTWQTRGAQKPQRPFLERVVRETPPSTWYVSITFWDDVKRAKVEPKAPSIEYRLELIQMLLEAGHSVQVGMNPIHSDWLPDPEPLLDRLLEIGVDGVAIYPLYFDQTFRDNLTPKAIHQMGEELVESVGASIKPDQLAYLQQTIQYAEGIGLPVMSDYNHGYSAYWDPWEELYDNVMPHWQQVINPVDLSLEEGDEEGIVVLTKQDALGMLSPLPEMDWSRLLLARRANHFRTLFPPMENGKLPKVDAETMMDVIWNDEKFGRRLGLVGKDRFSFASVYDGDNIIPIVDENNDRIVVYRRKGWKYMYVHTPELAE